jgi:hypothetical protein
MMSLSNSTGLLKLTEPHWSASLDDSETTIEEH